MSESLIGNVNLNQLKETYITLKIKNESFKIKELTACENKIEIVMNTLIIQCN